MPPKGSKNGRRRRSRGSRSPSTRSSRTSPRTSASRSQVPGARLAPGGPHERGREEDAVPLHCDRVRSDAQDAWQVDLRAGGIWSGRACAASARRTHSRAAAASERARSSCSSCCLRNTLRRTRLPADLLQRCARAAVTTARIWHQWGTAPRRLRAPNPSDHRRDADGRSASCKTRALLHFREICKGYGP